MRQAHNIKTNHQILVAAKIKTAALVGFVGRGGQIHGNIFNMSIRLLNMLLLLKTQAYIEHEYFTYILSNNVAKLYDWKGEVDEAGD